MPIKDLEQRRRYMREWMANRRAEWFANKVCVECGSSDQLELDHEDPAIKVSHRVWSWSDARRDAELAKCVARCEPCHLAKTNRNHEFAKTTGSGQANGNAKLTESDVQAIRTSQLSRSRLAVKYDVTYGAIANIQLRRTWKHLP